MCLIRTANFIGGWRDAIPDAVRGSGDHRRILAQSGGDPGVRDLGAVESAVAQPAMIFGGKDLYPTIAGKASAICFSRVMNHPFVDGNKRVGHAAMETFLVLNGYELRADVDGAERTILQLAAGQLTRDALVDWVTTRVERHGST